MPKNFEIFTGKHYRQDIFWERKMKCRSFSWQKLSQTSRNGEKVRFNSRWKYNEEYFPNILRILFQRVMATITTHLWATESDAYRKHFADPLWIDQPNIIMITITHYQQTEIMNIDAATRSKH